MQWYYLDGNNEQQPFVAKDAPSLAQHGVLGGETLVWNEGMADWEPASAHFPEIFAAQQPAAVAAPTETAAPAPAAAAVIKKPEKKATGLKTVSAPTAAAAGSAVSPMAGAGDPAPLVKRIATELGGASGWMKLVGGLSYFGAAMYFLAAIGMIISSFFIMSVIGTGPMIGMIFGGLLVAALGLIPFFLGKYVWCGASGVKAAQFSGDLGELTEGLANTRKFFTMLGVLALIQVIFMILYIVLVLGAGVVGMFGAMSGMEQMTTEEVDYSDFGPADEGLYEEE